VFLDAGARIALADRSDTYHSLATRVRDRLYRDRRRLVTTSLVIAESYALIRRAAGLDPGLRLLQALRQSARLTAVFPGAAEQADAELVLRQYADQDFSLVDAVSFAVGRSRGIDEAFGFDSHFLAAGFMLTREA
jgi:predicted nucleic acid-binding protein